MECSKREERVAGQEATLAHIGARAQEPDVDHVTDGCLFQEDPKGTLQFHGLDTENSYEWVTSFIMRTTFRKRCALTMYMCREV